MNATLVHLGLQIVTRQKDSTTRVIVHDILIFLVLVGEDGTFNLLEYADDLALDTALDDEHDKSIFDEHLGITDDVPTGSTTTSTAASTTGAPKATTAATATTTANNVPATTSSVAATAGPATSAVAAAVAGAATQPATSKAPVIAETAAPATGGPKPNEEVKSEPAVPGPKVKTEEEPIKTKIVPPPLPKIEQIPSPPEKTPGSASSDFQAKFLEFSQRGKPPKESGDVKTEKGTAEEGAAKVATEEVTKETKDVPQLDGLYDPMDEDDAYDADDEYTVPQLDGWFDEEESDDDNEVCEILQVDGLGDPPEQPAPPPPGAPPQGAVTASGAEPLPSGAPGPVPPPLPPPMQQQQPGSAPNSAPPTPTPTPQPHLGQGPPMGAPMPSQSPQHKSQFGGSPMGVRPQAPQGPNSEGQSPYSAAGHMSPRMPPVGSPHAGGPPPYPLAHRQSPHPSQSPHHGGPSPGPVGMSPRNVPSVSPHPSQSPHANMGTPQGGGPPHYPPVPSPMGVHSQHPGAPSPHPVQSPHPHSRSTTPQMSPRGSHSQPGTPQLTPTSTPATPGISGPATPTANTPTPQTSTSAPTTQPPMMSTASPVSAAPVPPATVAGMMLRGPRPPTMPGQQQQQQPGQITAPGQMPMMRPDQAATTAGTQHLSHFSAASTGTGTQSSLSQLAAMSQAPRPAESVAPAGITPAGMLAQQRPGMRPFMPGQGMPGQHPQGMHGQPPQGMPGQPGMVQTPRSAAGVMMNHPRSMAPSSTMTHTMQEQQQQVGVQWSLLHLMAHTPLIKELQ